MKNAKRIAFCAVLSALAFAIMFAGSVVQVLSYTASAAAAILILIVLVEFGVKYAVMMYLVVSALSLLLLPEKTIAFAFAIVFGFYPVIKNIIESRVSKKTLNYLFKILFILLTVTAENIIYVFVLGIEDFGSPLLFGAICILMTVVMIVYDYCLSKFLIIYVAKIRPKIVRFL